MLNLNSNQDLKYFVNTCEKVLHDKANHHNIPINELDWYYQPLSPQHLSKYKAVYSLPSVINAKSKNFIFLRFVHSLFNSGFHNDMKYDKDNHDRVQLLSDLAKSTFNFDINQFNNQFSNNIQYENHLRTYKSIATLKKDRLNRNARSILEIAQYISNNKLFNKNNVFKKPPIFNMGIALFQDAVKECGLQDIAKPDTHIIDALNKAFNKNYKKNVSPKETIEIQNIMKTIANANNMTVYKLDKIIWLVCANESNTFYLHQRTNYKAQLLSLI